ncbi:oligopeptide transporter subunit; ATP-binding component of ABC superfamily [uncultured Eubacteriales bacterium]|uniref:Oligopeptide transporter subunit ATP-binding component of ABC superfamily n=1 Tax=uncultured Eubacteriales bacterium TaxID=172733 RepID=A0A212J149_9FIRM|nr:oligopeptide transporter subunit; ATP-binding component of ABC superfamily [uncultured Eubacteriales bacterium]
MSDAVQPLLRLENTKVYYPLRGGVFSRVTGHVKAVDDVSFSIHPHETLGLVGESGCGKSTIGRAIMRLEDITAGRILFDGEDITGHTRRHMRTVWPRMQMVFQDPYSSLNPRKTVEDTLAEILLVHRVVPPVEVDGEIDRILGLIGLNPDSKKRYPHEFSGGQRQRISIAKALTLRPKLLICDEAISALDVSIQAQILSLFQELRGKLGLTYLFIAHGLGAVKYTSDRIAVMYLGKIVEIAKTELLFSDPRHPYTQALLSAYPDPNPRNRGRNRIVLGGSVPSPADPPSGCHFRTRCPFAQPLCAESVPELAGDGDHSAACHFQISRSDWRAQP